MQRQESYRDYKMKFVLVHGFNVKDGGANSVDRLAPYLTEAGHEVDKDEADYGYFSLFMVRLRKHRAILRIAEALDQADVVIAHSNGANYVHKAVRLTSRPIKIILVAPALNRSVKWPAHVQLVSVFYTRSDHWVFLSGFLLFHSWGWLGWKGPRRDDPIMVGHDHSDIVKRHSDYFDEAHAAFTTKQILKVV